MGPPFNWENKITFVHAPELYYEQNHGVQFVPIWAYTLTSYLDPYWNCEIIDLSVEKIQTISLSKVFIFSGINQDFFSLKKAVHYLKKKYPKSIFILGGPITWSYEKNGNLEDLYFFDHLFLLEGEETLNLFLTNVKNGELNTEKVFRAKSRFPLYQSKKMNFKLLQKKAHHYYGGVLEVSRGCPFLCEFCDIRVLPENNSSHGKDPQLIIEELKEYHRLGIFQIQFACDNFIGNLTWAHDCLDAILEWKKQSKAELAIHTWVTVNLAKHSKLMIKMKEAGFTSLFIGVESFHSNSILETSKLQNHNKKDEMVHSLKTIQSFGFIIAPGLIFGFDSDPPEMFELTLKGVEDSGLIGGDPTFLLALPGTPLYERMKKSKRLVDLSIEKARVSKIESNIYYLQPKDFLIYGFIHFINQFTSNKFNLNRFKNHIQLIKNTPSHVSKNTKGYGNLPKFIFSQFRSISHLKMFLFRLFILSHPLRLLTLLQAWVFLKKHTPQNGSFNQHFYFWVFAWSNLLVKYRNLNKKDFKIHSWDKNFSQNLTFDLPTETGSEFYKVAQQKKSTQKALLELNKFLTENQTEWTQKYENKIKEFRSSL